MKFKAIQEKNWIKSINNNSSGIGLTFENLIEKNQENFELPDYKGIEIKTHTSSSNAYITLFSSNPDGDYLFEIQRLYNNYGYPDRIKKDMLAFAGNINGKTAKFVGIKYKFKLRICTNEEKIRLEIYDKNNNFIEDEISWTFDILSEKLYRKLNTLAFITADKRIQNSNYYYKYTQIKFYKLKSFDVFVNLIKNGKIIVSFSLGTIREGSRTGQMHNHGTAFRILKEDLELLYDEVQ